MDRQTRQSCEGDMFVRSGDDALTALLEIAVAATVFGGCYA